MQPRAAHAPVRWIYEPWKGLYHTPDHRPRWYTQDTVTYHVKQMRKHDVPLGVIHLDGSIWAQYHCTCTFDPGRFPDPKGMAGTLARQGIRLLPWMVPHLDENSPEYSECARRGYLVTERNGRPFAFSDARGVTTATGGLLELRNREARTYLHRMLDQILDVGASGIYLDGILYDVSFGPGTWNSPYEYMDEYTRQVLEYCRARRPDFEVVLKLCVRPAVSDAYARHYGNVCYIGDHGSDAKGLRQAVLDFLKFSQVVPGAYCEIPGWYGPVPDTPTYVRWMHWAAFQPVWAGECSSCVDPYCPEHGGREILEAYRYYATLHSELVPYIYALAHHANRTGEPIVREPDPKCLTYRLGPSVFVAPVWDDESCQRAIHLPEGDWLNYWNETEIIKGPTKRTLEVPAPGTEPIFIRDGALIPMHVRSSVTGHGTAASDGHLTVLAYPSGRTAFDVIAFDDRTAMTIACEQTGPRIRLTCEPFADPVIFRVRAGRAPRSIRAGQGSGLWVELDGSSKAGAEVPRFDDEQALGAARRGWCYLADRKVAVVKVSKPG